MIPFSKPSLGQEEATAARNVILSGWLAAGQETEKFEQEFSDYISPPGEHYYCIFTNSCTSALKMAYKWASEQGVTGISYPANTFCATYSAATESGLAIYPRVCQHGGIGDKLCLKTLADFASNADKHILLGLTKPVAGSVVASVNINGNWERDLLRKQNGKKENTLAQKQSSEKRDQTISTLGTTGLCTCGFVETGAKPRPVNNVVYDNIQWVTKTIFNGQTKMEHIPELERIGSNSVENATLGLIARVNMAYGGVKDETPCLIEDSAHRIEPNDPLVGKIRCYSFYATKNMTTGQGGMFVTNDKEIYERARLYWRDGLSSSTQERLSGKSYNYRVEAMAGGYDGNDVAAAIGRVQLRRLPEFTQRRNAIKDKYNEAFGQDWQGNHLYPYFVDSIARVHGLIETLKAKEIAAGYHYPGTGWLGVSLPLYPDLTDEQVQYIIDSVKEWNASST